MIVVDSSVWIDFFNGVSTPEVERLDGWLGVTPLAIGDLILVEVMQGVRSERDVATARQLNRAEWRISARNRAWGNRCSQQDQGCKRWPGRRR